MRGCLARINQLFVSDDQKVAYWCSVSGDAAALDQFLTNRPRFNVNRNYHVSIKCLTSGYLMKQYASSSVCVCLKSNGRHKADFRAVTCRNG